MSHSYKVTVDDLEFQVCFTCDSEGIDAEIEEITLDGEVRNIQSLYIKNPRKHHVFGQNEFIPLEDYLLDEALIQLYNDGGALYHDEIAAAEHKYDSMKEEGRI